MGFHEHRGQTTKGVWEWAVDWYLLTEDVLNERPGTDRALTRFELALSDGSKERTYRLRNVAPALEEKRRDRVYRLEKEVDRHTRTLDLEAVYDDADWWSHEPRTETRRYDAEGNAEAVRFHEEQLLGEDVYRATDVTAERDPDPPWHRDGPWHVTGSMHRIVASPVEAFRVIEHETGVDVAAYIEDLVPGRLNW